MSFICFEHVLCALRRPWISIMPFTTLRAISLLTLNSYSNFGRKKPFSTSPLENSLHYNCLCELSCYKVGPIIARRFHIDRSKVPELFDEDLEESFVKGSGPGGQSVNKTVNCVVLKHTPTGLVVRCHESRLLHKNRLLAREKLTTKLDNLLNGQLSVEAQIKRRDQQIKSKRESKARKHRNMKEKYKNFDSDQHNQDAL